MLAFAIIVALASTILLIRTTAQAQPCQGGVGQLPAYRQACRTVAIAHTAGEISGGIAGAAFVAALII